MPSVDAHPIRDLRSMEVPAPGVLLTFHSPELVELYGGLGFGWLLLDAEHSPLSPGTCRELTRAADLVGMPCVVRVPELRSCVIESFLDVGVTGILAPNVSSADDARLLVAATKFARHGERGSAPTSRAARYGLMSSVEYIRHANARTFAAVLIESQQGVEQLESILAVPGLDCVAVGANDLALSLGLAAGMGNPRVRALVEAAQRSIRASGKKQMTVVADADAAHRAFAGGAALVAVSDAMLIAGAGRAYLASALRALSRR